LRLSLGLSKSQSETVAGFVLSHGEEYVRAKAQIVESKSIRNRAAALLTALLDDWQLPFVPARIGGLPEGQKGLTSAESQGRERKWKW
jgi:hypothetical protein